MNIQYQVDEVKFIKIQSLIQKEKPPPNDIKKLFDSDGTHPSEKNEEKNEERNEETNYGRKERPK